MALQCEHPPRWHRVSHWSLTAAHHPAPVMTLTGNTRWRSSTPRRSRDARAQAQATSTLGRGPANDLTMPGRHLRLSTTSTRLYLRQPRTKGTVSSLTQAHLRVPPYHSRPLTLPPTAETAHHARNRPSLPRPTQVWGPVEGVGVLFLMW